MCLTRGRPRCIAAANLARTPHQASGRMTMRLVDQVRHVLRLKHYSYRTEQCYVAWIERYVRYCKGAGEWRHPAELGAADVESFLTHLAADRHVSASTQNQALNAVVFLYRDVLRQELGDFAALGRSAVAARPRFCPLPRSPNCCRRSSGNRNRNRSD